MERTFRDTPREVLDLKARLTRRDELEGLLVRAVGGLRSLLERGHFDVPESIQGANRSYRTRLDSVGGFVEDWCVLHDAAWSPRSALYSAYREWCQDNGREPSNSATFYDRLLSKHRPEVTLVTHRGKRGFRGVALGAKS